MLTNRSWESCYYPEWIAVVVHVILRMACSSCTCYIEDGFVGKKKNMLFPRSSITQHALGSRWSGPFLPFPWAPWPCGGDEVRERAVVQGEGGRVWREGWGGEAISCAASGSSVPVGGHLVCLQHLRLLAHLCQMRWKYAYRRCKLDEAFTSSWVIPSSSGFVTVQYGLSVFRPSTGFDCLDKQLMFE